ncbi:choice-of-anchor A family protein [Teredinibacter haidensis]|uniref:choice-of-anchor A family protein n=1 Tax=Teredinibacter haidensis TaxID=2731755 RepID=UPI0009491991|nr:choice-of-anchor A family protein [Teredinibacter haidensis]
MYQKALKVLIATAAVAISLNATALPLSEYNLILAEDYNFSGGDVEGKTFIGGNLNASGRAVDLATKEPTLTLSDTVKVVGDINANNINIQHGNIIYAGSNNVTGSINFNGAGGLIHDSSLSIDAVMADLETASLQFSGLSANGAYTTGTTSLDYLGSDAVAVFNVDATDIFAQNNSLRLNYNAAETVIINVSGSIIEAKGGVNLVDGFRSHELGARNILWNFFEADTIDFNNIAMFGSVLAAGADITGGAVFDGSVAANSYTGGREFHRFLFNPPAIDVPEPSSGILLMLGIGLLALGRQRQLSKSA